MSAQLLAESSGAAVYHATATELLDVVPECDALIVDAPYSKRTHAGHDDGINSANRIVHRGLIRGREQTERDVAKIARRPIEYRAWTEDDVRGFVESWSPRVRGWLVTITDHVLQQAWADAFADEGRYVFAPLPYVAPGSRIRLSGDGPSCWATWIVVARPKSRAFAGWGALAGGYVLPPGMSADLPVVGGKPAWLMQRLVEDYSRPGDLVVDPCCGAGTTAIGAIRSNRRAIVGDQKREHADLAAQWIKHPERAAPSLEKAADPRQPALFDGAA